MIKKVRATFPGLLPTVAGVLSLVAVTSWYDMHLAHASNPSPLNISQVPLTVTTSVHPQVLILLGNSQSTDGDLSGAINTGAGVLATADSSLYASSSPSSYTIPSGFTPPVNPGSGGIAPYTVNVGGTLYDNGPSRLNVAKQGIAAILQSYMQNTDFGLEDYSPTGGPGLYTTYVYYMSPPSGFTFTNTSGALGTGGATETVPNPCYGYQTATANVKANCTAIAGTAALNYGATTLNSSLYMQVLASSDDASINDVLYDGYTNDVFVDYNGPHPGSPYTSFTLAQYNAGSVYISYSNVIPNNGVNETGPTNAGYVPYSAQVMYAMRGFGYYTGAYGNSGSVIVSLANGNAGQNPTTGTVNAAIAHFTPFLAPETNNTGTGEIKALAVQSPLAGMLTTAKTTLAAAATANGSCTLQQYVVLISDGLPTEDLSGRSWPPAGSSAAAGYGMTAAFNGDGSLNASGTNDQALIDTINSITNLKTAGVKTYVVGLGAGVDPALNPIAAQTLQAMSVAGGTGNYIAATSPDALVSGLNSVLTAIQQGSLATSAVAVNSTSLQSGDLEFQANFTSSDVPYSDWTGDVTATTLDPATGQPTGAPVWSAQAQLDISAAGAGYVTNRAIATWNPNTGPSLNIPAGVGFAWGNLNATQQSQLNLTDSLGTRRLAYLRGYSGQEVRNGGTFRNRSHILGDIVDSQPYFEQVSTASQLVYVGANDGMLHAFNANTGIEQFAFIPNAVFNNLASLTQPLYNQSHRFFVDGSPNVGTSVFTDGLTHTIVASGENAGGNSVFALDVSNPTLMVTDATVASQVLWEFTDSDLGLTYAQPQFAVMAASPGSAVIFGNGYNSPNNNSVLYFVNPQTGATIAKINLCTSFPAACSSSAPQGLSTIATGQSDGLQGVPITQVYAGDLQGNLWAVDVSDPSPSNWVVRLLFQARDSLGNAQPITTPPVVTLNPKYPHLLGNFVMFGTGQLLQNSDLSTTGTQSVYGIFDRMPASASVTLTRANLVAQTLTAESAAASGLPQGILFGTNNAVSLVSSSGWYDDLLSGGQRVITNPALLYGAFLTTLNTPPGSNCGGQFSSTFLELNYATGGTFSSPQLDVNGSGTITAADTINGSNPVGINLGNHYGSAPVLLGVPKPGGPNPGPGLKIFKKTITLSNGTQTIINELLNAPPRSSWWQIQ